MSEEGFTLIKEGRLPWISQFDRNPLGVQLSSSYENGDTAKYFMEVKLFENTSPFYEYIIRFPQLRDPDSMILQFSEIELPGLLLPAPDVASSSTVRCYILIFYRYDCLVS